MWGIMAQHSEQQRYAEKTQVYTSQHKIQMEQEKNFLLSWSTELRLVNTSFPFPYIGRGRSHLSVNLFLSLTLSHHYLCRNAFPSGPTLSFHYALRYVLSDLACPRPLSALLRSNLVCLVVEDEQQYDLPF